MILSLHIFPPVNHEILIQSFVRLLASLLCGPALRVAPNMKLELNNYLSTGGKRERERDKGRQGGKKKDCSLLSQEKSPLKFSF